MFNSIVMSQTGPKCDQDDMNNGFLVFELTKSEFKNWRRYQLKIDFIHIFCKY